MNQCLCQVSTTCSDARPRANCSLHVGTPYYITLTGSRKIGEDVTCKIVSSKCVGMTVEQLYSIIYKRFDLIFDLVAALSVCIIRNKAFISLGQEGEEYHKSAERRKINLKKRSTKTFRSLKSRTLLNTNELSEKSEITVIDREHLRA